MQEKRKGCEAQPPKSIDRRYLNPTAVTERKASGARPHTALTSKTYRYDNISTRDLLFRLQICALLFQQH